MRQACQASTSISTSVRSRMAPRNVLRARAIASPKALRPPFVGAHSKEAASANERRVELDWCCEPDPTNRYGDLNPVPI